jgi:hypothetical protein
LNELIDVDTCVCNTGCPIDCAVECGNTPPDAGTVDAGTVDPCMGIPATGTCIGNTAEYCTVPTGSGSASIQTVPCGASATCQLVAMGGTNHAQCVSNTQCMPGQSQCLSGLQLETCGDAGTWLVSSCANGCATSGTSAACSPSATMAYSGHLLYEVRDPNAAHPTDWATTTYTANAGFLSVFSETCGTTTCQVVDSTVTDSTGNFTVQVPSALDAGDYVIFATIAYDSSNNIKYLLGDPGLDGGTHTVPANVNAKVWQWHVQPANVASGSTLTITEANHSGAMRVYDYVRFAYEHAVSQFGGTAGLTVSAWLGYGNSWSCGSCFSESPITLFGQQIDTQIWFDAALNDERWWSTAVTSHEMGHWVMASYGLPPGEGGRHCFAVPESPGIAWSEGWATWHSSDLRGNSVYYDKQNGTMFYWDIDTRAYSPTVGATWPRPTASAGLTQQMDENEISAMLWSIRNGSASSNLYSALASTRMTTRISQSPSLRGYTSQTWTVNPTTCQEQNIMSTGNPAPFIADMLDALTCGGVSTSVIDAATDPTVHYPYMSASPLCQAPEAPVVASLSKVGDNPGATAVIARIEHRGPYPIPLDVEVRLPPGARVISGPTQWASPAADGPRVEETQLTVDFGLSNGGDLTLVVDGHAPGFGLHAERPLRETAVPVLDAPRAGPHLVLKGHDLGPSIPISAVSR